MEHAHDWQKVRVKGRYTRKQCSTCLVFQAWKKNRPNARQLAELTVPDLRKMAKAKALHGYTTMNKAALIAALTEVKPV